MAGETTPQRRWAVRLAWLALYWLFGVAAMGIVAVGLRLAMAAAGLSR